jgi:hypothetical protein
MADPLADVRPGDDFQPSAELHNRTIETIRTVEDWATGLATGRNLYNQTMITVRNDTGADRGQFHCLALGQPLADPATLLARFRQSIRFAGNLPAQNDHGRAAILRRPLKDGRTGPAIVAGLTPVQVELQNPYHTRATLKEYQCDALLSDDFGPAQIIWRAGNSGTVWAIVRLGNPAGTRFFELKTTLIPGGSATAYIRQRNASTGALETDTSRTFLVVDDIGDRYGIGRDDAGSGGRGAYGKAEYRWTAWYVYDLECP